MQKIFAVALVLLSHGASNAVAAQPSAIAICVAVNNDQTTRKFKIERHDAAYTITFGNGEPQPISRLDNNDKRVLLVQKRENGSSIAISLLHDTKDKRSLGNDRVVVMLSDKSGNIVSTIGGACQTVGFVP